MMSSATQITPLGTNQVLAHTALRNPTHQEEEAITALFHVNERELLAWIRHARGTLSSLQHDAVQALKDCDDSLIITWLRQARPAGKSCPIIFNWIFVSMVLTSLL